MEAMKTPYSGCIFVEGCDVEVAVEVCLAVGGDVVDAVAEVDEETVVDQCRAALVDVGSREADAAAIGHAFGGVGAVFGEVLQDAVVGPGHPGRVVAHRGRC